MPESNPPTPARAGTPPTCAPSKHTYGCVTCGATYSAIARQVLGDPTVGVGSAHVPAVDERLCSLCGHAAHDQREYCGHCSTDRDGYAVWCQCGIARPAPSPAASADDLTDEQCANLWREIHKPTSDEDLRALCEEDPDPPDESHKATIQGLAKELLRERMIRRTLDAASAPEGGPQAVIERAREWAEHRCVGATGFQDCAANVEPAHRDRRNSARALLEAEARRANARESAEVRGAALERAEERIRELEHKARNGPAIATINKVAVEYAIARAEHAESRLAASEATRGRLEALAAKVPHLEYRYIEGSLFRPTIVGPYHASDVERGACVRLGGACAFAEAAGRERGEPSDPPK